MFIKRDFRCYSVFYKIFMFIIAIINCNGGLSYSFVISEISNLIDILKWKKVALVPIFMIHKRIGQTTITIDSRYYEHENIVKHSVAL